MKYKIIIPQEEPKQLNPEYFGLPQLGTKEFNDLTAVYFGGKPKQETLEEAAEIDLSNLCYYDRRNPDCTADDEAIEDHKAQLLRVSKKLGYNKTCSCDNCFYGRSKLTEQLIRQQERMYSEKEVESLLHKFMQSQHPDWHGYSTTKWFEQFKKK